MDKAKVELPTCPKCGEPARVAIVVKARVRCALDADGEVGKVLSVSRDASAPVAFECGGCHVWEVGS